MLPHETTGRGSTPGPFPPTFLRPPRAALPWRVIKLGGTTVADAGAVAGAVRHLADLVARKRVAVVVSALAGVTDTIAGLVADARRGDLPSDALDRLARRHVDHLESLLTPSPGHVVAGVGAEVAALRGVLVALRGAARRPASATDGETVRDLSSLALSIGERLSARLLHAVAGTAGIGDVELVDAARLLVADGSAADARPDPAATRRRTAGHLATSRARLWVVPGFFARDRHGRLRLLGRGGSDTSATLLGAALAADRVEIWTDVDGVHSADPRRDPQARRFDRLGFAHAERLARRGARVLHAAAIAPARAADIPIVVRDAFRLERAGTWIGADAPARAAGARS